MEKIKFYPLTIDYVNLGNSSYVRVFGRSVDGDRICVYDTSLKPYFYVIPRKGVNLSQLSEKVKAINTSDTNDRPVEIHSVEIVKKNMLAKEIELIKVECGITKDVSILKELIKEEIDVLEIVEHDIKFTQRFLIDKQISMLSLCEVEGEQIESYEDVDLVFRGEIKQISEELIKDPRILVFDIETYTKGDKYSDSEHDPIATIAFYSNYGFKKVITWKKVDLDYVEILNDEREMLLEFMRIIKIEEPDFLVGYYSDGFDLPYIKTRCDEHKIKLRLSLDGSNVRVVKGAESAINLIGFSHIDVIKFIRRIMVETLETESYDLSSVAKELIGDGKVEIDFDKIMEAWYNSGDIKKLCEYNLKDVELTLKVFLKILPNLYEIVKFVGAPIHEVCRSTFGQLAENYLLKNIHRFNEVILSRPNFESLDFRRYQSYEGGYVFEPSPGVYKDVCVVDFRSLYPSIIHAHNICPSTITKEKKNSFESPEINGEKYYFTKDHQGFVSELIKELIERRIKVKDELKKNKDQVLSARSYALKIISNSFYGYLGYPGARWYSIECATSIAAYARYYVKEVITKASKDFTVIYSDTDSCFLVLGNKTKNDVIKFVNKLNDELPGLMQIDIEGFYEKGIFVSKKGDGKGAKKKYALLDSRGELVIKGFESIRTDWSYLAREVQRKVIEMVLSDDNSKNTIKYLQKVVNEINNSEIEIHRMGIRTQLKKNLDEYRSIGPHVAVAKKLVARGVTVKTGSVIEYVITSGKGKIRDKAMFIDEAKNYDADYYINNQILPAVRKILEVLGFKEEDILTTSVQSRLGDF